MNKRILLLIGVGDALVAIAGPLLDRFSDQLFKVSNGDVFLSSALALIAVSTLVGFIAAGSPTGTLQDVMREAIASAFVATYLVVVAWTLFFSAVSVERAAQQTLPTLTTTMLSNFTQLTGVVLVFYFGASAFAAVFAPRAKSNGDAPVTTTDVKKSTV